MPVPSKKLEIERAENNAKDNAVNILQFAAIAEPEVVLDPAQMMRRLPGKANLDHAAVLLIEAAYDLAGQLPPERVTEIMRLAKKVEVLSRSLS